MEIVLQIPAQPAVAEARDAKLPAQIHFTENDNFPWGEFLQKVAVMWQLSQNDSIPKGFRLKKKLPQSIVDLLPKVDSKDALNVLKQLGSAGFFSAFSKF